MPYCPNCGMEVTSAMSFCPGCGKGLGAAQTTAQTTASYTTASTERNDYSVILMDCGTCSKTVVTDLLEDLLGYSTAEAKKLLTYMPAEAAVNLTEEQAQYTAQALAEYGIQVSIYNSDGYVNMDARAVSSVYDNQGNFIPVVSGVLAMLGTWNRVREISRWRYYDQAPIFRPAYRPPMEPMHVRRPYHPAPAPGRPMGGAGMGARPMGGAGMGARPMGGAGMGARPMGGAGMGARPMGGSGMGARPTGGPGMSGHSAGGSGMGGGRSMGGPSGAGRGGAGPSGQGGAGGPHRGAMGGHGGR